LRRLGSVMSRFRLSWSSLILRGFGVVALILSLNESASTKQEK
jgi:hypothetical protein